MDVGGKGERLAWAVVRASNKQVKIEVVIGCFGWWLKRSWPKLARGKWWWQTMLLMHVGMSSEWGLNKCFARGKLAVCRGGN